MPKISTSTLFVIVCVLVVLRLISTLGTTPTSTSTDPSSAAARQLRAVVSADISGPAQWTLLSSNLEHWHGVWVRLDAAGLPVQRTRHSRSFDQISASTILQTNYVHNETFSVLGTHYSYYLFDRAFPLIDNYYALDNAVDHHRLFKFTGSFLMFYPSAYTVWGSLVFNASASYASFEKFVRRPGTGIQDVRLSVAPVYKFGTYRYVAYAREVSTHVHYPNEFSYDTYARVHTGKDREANALNRFNWSAIKRCIDSKFTYTLYNVVGKVSIPTFDGVHGDRVFLQLPGGVLMNVPSTIDLRKDPDADRFLFRWVDGQDTVVFSETTYHLNGSFASDCTTEFSRT